MDKKEVHRAWIGLGSNLGNRKEHLLKAQQQMRKMGLEIAAVSGIYESEAWGYDSGNRFFNMCLECSTAQTPADLLAILKDIEAAMGRKSLRGSYEDRIIDLDILFYDGQIMRSAALIIPHPELAKRKFVLAPLSEIAPWKQHPVLKVTVEQLYHTCNDPGEVTRLS